jgi:hypothetical protein
LLLRTSNLSQLTMSARYSALGTQHFTDSESL